jgi:hypothetical protein
VNTICTPGFQYTLEVNRTKLALTDYISLCFKIKPIQIYFGVLMMWSKLRLRFQWMQVSNPEVSIYLSVYGSAVLCWTLATFSNSSSYRDAVGLLGRSISPSQGRYIHTEQHKHSINAPRHPCPEWDSNPRSHRSNKRRQFSPRPCSHCDRPNPELALLFQAIMQAEANMGTTRWMSCILTECFAEFTGVLSCSCPPPLPPKRSLLLWAE